MKVFDQTFKTYNNLDEAAYQTEITEQFDLGFEVFNHSTENQKTTITFRRSKDLKFYFRLNDLSNKISETLKLKSEIILDIYDRKSYASSKMKTHRTIGIYIFLFLILFDALLISLLFYGKSKFIDLLPYFLAMIMFHTFHVFWHKSIRKKANTEDLDSYVSKIDSFITELRLKSKKVSKEIK